jgi:hypothetical protein
MYDLIGDIHGHADELRALLHHLDYQPDAAGVPRHAGGRQVIFLGDYIDRGPKIRETLQLVRGMVEGGAALAILGNHEYNALTFWQKDPASGYLRPHRPGHTNQHWHSITEAFNTPELFQEWHDYLAWFLTLPLALELPGLRAVHACWEPRHIAYLRGELPGLRLTLHFLLRASRRGSPEFEAVEVTLKGREVALPRGVSFHDKDGHRRDLMRVRWWQNPAAAAAYREYYLEDLPELRGQPVVINNLDPWHYQDEKPVFFGHYWLRGTPQLLQPYAVCLDYSVARGGQLIGYRWHGEPVLRADHLVWVP